MTQRSTLFVDPNPTTDKPKEKSGANATNSKDSKASGKLDLTPTNPKDEKSSEKPDPTSTNSKDAKSSGKPDSTPTNPKEEKSSEKAEVSPTFNMILEHTMKFVVYHYLYQREDKPLATKAADTVKAGFSSVTAPIKKVFYSTAVATAPVQDERKDFCKIFSTYKIKPENIVELLMKLGTAADTIQKTQGGFFSKKNSSFMEYFHGLRQYLLYKILGPEKLTPISNQQTSPSGEVKKVSPEADKSIEAEYKRAILAGQESKKSELSQKIQLLSSEIQIGRCTPQTANSIQDEINELRRHLVYLGRIDHLFQDCNTLKILFDPTGYLANADHPLPALPYVIQRKYAMTLIKEIYKNNSAVSLSGKLDEEVIQFLEKQAADVKPADLEKHITKLLSEETNTPQPTKSPAQPGQRSS